MSNKDEIVGTLRKAGVSTDLYVGEAMPHGGFGMNTPEDIADRDDMQRWLKQHWN